MNRALSWFCKIVLKPVVKNLFIKGVKGWENIPKGNFILASNHQSHLDEIANAYLCVPRAYRFIGQTDSYKGFTKFWLYIIYFIAGVIRLNRKSDESKKEVVKKAIKALRDGDILIIYPEGTRTRTGEVGKGRKGIARIFLATKKPILPVAIKGTFELMPPGGKIKIKKIIRISIGKPLYFREELKKAKIFDKNSNEYSFLMQKITDKVMEEIRALKSELNQEE